VEKKKKERTGAKCSFKGGKGRAKNVSSNSSQHEEKGEAQALEEKGNYRGRNFCGKRKRGNIAGLIS